MSQCQPIYVEISIKLKQKYKTVLLRNKNINLFGYLNRLSSREPISGVLLWLQTAACPLQALYWHKSFTHPLSFYPFPNVRSLPTTGSWVTWQWLILPPSNVKTVQLEGLEGRVSVKITAVTYGPHLQKLPFPASAIAVLARSDGSGRPGRCQLSSNRHQLDGGDRQKLKGGERGLYWSTQMCTQAIKPPLLHPHFLLLPAVTVF